MKNLILITTFMILAITAFTSSCQASEFGNQSPEDQQTEQLELCLDEVEKQYVDLDGVMTVSSKKFSELLFECECEIQKTNCK